MGKDSFPDYLLSFGRIEENLVSHHFVSRRNIISIGNYYLEYMISEKTNRQIKEIISSLRRSYKKIMLISSQDLVQKELITFLSEAAENLPDAAFILVPRRQQAIIKLNTKPENLLIMLNINLYQCCRLCDFHSTVFSTFAAESIYMGVPNILINLKNLSDSYYSEIFSSHRGVKFVNNVEEYVETIINWNPPEKNKIKRMSMDLFAKENLNKIRLFLNHHLNL